MLLEKFVWRFPYFAFEVNLSIDFQIWLFEVILSGDFSIYFRCFFSFLYMPDINLNN